MTTRQLHGVLQYLRGAIAVRLDNHVADAELVERFFASRDEAAFELLVWRHHRLVLGVCSRILADASDVEDAFQASFLVLARRAGAIRKRASLSSWLYGVARRVALEARRRNARPLPVRPAATSCEPADELIRRELQDVFDEELSRLPKKYRVPVILCYLEGRTYAEAAERLGCSRGTISTLLTKARELLRARLTRRGITLSAGSLAAWLCGQAASASAADSLVAATVKAGLAAGAAVAGSVLTLTEGVLKAMALSKIKNVASVLLFLAFLGLGAGLYLVGGSTSQAEAKNLTPPAQEAFDEGVVPSAPQSGTKDREPIILLSIEAAGRIVELAVKEGDKVRANDILLRLDEAEQKLNVDRARAVQATAMAEVESASATAKEAALREERAKKLYAAKSIGMEEYGLTALTHTKARSDVTVKEAALRIAETEVQRAQLILQRHVLRTPVSGVVKTLLKSKGESVKAGEGVLQILVDPTESLPKKATSGPGEGSAGKGSAKEERLLPSTVEAAWDQLGLRLEVVGPAAVSTVKDDFRGGMRIVAIRPSSPAAATSLRTGDIVIGLHHWETLSRDSVPFILGYTQGAALRSLTFVVIRDNQILRGQFALGSP